MLQKLPDSKQIKFVSTLVLHTSHAARVFFRTHKTASSQCVICCKYQLFDTRPFKSLQTLTCVQPHSHRHSTPIHGHPVGLLVTGLPYGRSQYIFAKCPAKVSAEVPIISASSSCLYRVPRQKHSYTKHNCILTDLQGLTIPHHTPTLPHSKASVGDEPLIPILD